LRPAAACGHPLEYALVNGPELGTGAVRCALPPGAGAQSRRAVARV